MLPGYQFYHPPYFYIKNTKKVWINYTDLLLLPIPQEATGTFLFLPYSVNPSSVMRLLKASDLSENLIESEVLKRVSVLSEPLGRRQ